MIEAIIGPMTLPHAGVPSSTILGSSLRKTTLTFSPTIVEGGNRGEGDGERARRSDSSLPDREALA
jgi:hypothetical protein